MTAYRKVQDEDGQWWEVWESRPSIIDRRDGRERRTALRFHDRRQRDEQRLPVPHAFRYGWLCFQSGAEWRRVAPIPEGWDSLPDADLLALLLVAARAAS